MHSIRGILQKTFLRSRRRFKPCFCATERTTKNKVGKTFEEEEFRGERLQRAKGSSRENVNLEQPKKGGAKREPRA